MAERHRRGRVGLAVESLDRRVVPAVFGFATPGVVGAPVGGFLGGASQANTLALQGLLGAGNNALISNSFINSFPMFTGGPIAGAGTTAPVATGLFGPSLTFANPAAFFNQSLASNANLNLFGITAPAASFFAPTPTSFANFDLFAPSATSALGVPTFSASPTTLLGSSIFAASPTSLGNFSLFGPSPTSVVGFPSFGASPTALVGSSIFGASPTSFL